MDVESKNDYDGLFNLCQLAWNQFNERRKFEVQISIIFWTALGLGTAGSLTLKAFPSVPGGRLLLIAFGLAGVTLHGVWCFGIGRAQRNDREIAIFYERKMQALLDASFTPELKKKLGPSRKNMGRLWNWSYVFQLGVTTLLAFAFVITNWTRFP